MSQLLATVSPSPGRRIVAVGMLAAMGVLLLWIAIAAPPRELVWQIAIAVLGAFGAWLSRTVWIASAVGVELTRDELRLTDGTTLCRVEHIRSVDRGPFALKPSGGFVVTLDRPAPRGWTPGIWWRLGRRLGVGGVTSAMEGKYMADVIAAMVEERKSG